MKRIHFAFLRPMIGLTLIVISVLSMIWWENTGRRELLMETVLVAAENIERGTIIEKKHFQEVKGVAECMALGVVTPAEFNKIRGLAANQFIPKRGQVTKQMFARKEEMLLSGESVFQIKENWISSKSSSLRKGDVIDIFDTFGQLYLGTYRVAYVKDANEQEVTAPEGIKEGELLSRDFSSAVISNVEIIASLVEYQEIVELAEVQGIRFLLVQKGEEMHE